MQRFNFDNGGETVSLPAKFSVCPGCNGNGTELYGSMKGHAYTQAELSEDPDFIVDMLNGNYDVPCSRCKGLRVVPVMDVCSMSFEEKRAAVEVRHWSRYRSEQSAARERWIERGCFGDY